MPSFNHASFVAEAMTSVFNQTHPDIEFLIIDDCSTDTTFEIIRHLAANRQFNRRFRKLSISRNQHNLGAHAALNLGLESASGEFITFLNSDDAYEPARLSVLMSHYRSGDPGLLAFSAVRLIDDRGRGVRNHELKTVLEQGPARLQARLPSMSCAFLQHQLTGSTGNIFVDRKLLERVGRFAPLKYCHDWEFMLRAITLVEPCYVPETAYKYRIHAANTFASLQHLAAADTAAALASYFQRVANGRVLNTTAPTPQNWPHVFEMITRQFGVHDAWLREAHNRPRYASRQAALHGAVSHDWNSDATGIS
jgi:glycosyltransferase involved in cell wall biosynthesis